VRPSLREPLLTFLVVTALAAALYWIGRVVPLVHRNLHAFIAVSFFYAPEAAARLTGRGRFDYRSAGLHLDGLGRGAAVLAAAMALTFPLFVAAFFVYYGTVCQAANGWLAPLAGATPCRSWLGWSGGHLRLPPDFALLAASQVLVVALPEELFFRGYLLGRLQQRWPARRRFAGAPVGLALVLSALLFALGHFLVDFNPQRLAVFFPGLAFAWMRARSGSLLPGALYHALCNLLADVLHTSFF
jgi:membrane protease YdiL (CAAX protease family)